jgi:hypothetical protein
MIPLILAAVGGYLVYDSTKKEYKDGGTTNGLYKYPLNSLSDSDFRELDMIFRENDAAFYIDDTEKYVIVDIYAIHKNDLNKVREILRKVVGEAYADGGTTNADLPKYNSYEDFVNDNIGSKKYVVVQGSGGATQPFSGATKESIEKQFKELIYGEFMDGEFYYNYASNSDIKKEYLSFIKEYYNSLLESPQKFASFWKNNMTKSKKYESLYTIKDKYENIEDNFDYSTGYNKLNSKSKYVLAIKDRGQIKYEPIEQPESYQTYIFSEFKNKMSNKLKQEYIDYRKKYAGEDIKL